MSSKKTDKDVYDINIHIAILKGKLLYLLKSTWLIMSKNYRYKIDAKTVEHLAQLSNKIHDNINQLHSDKSHHLRDLEQLYQQLNQLFVRVQEQIEPHFKVSDKEKKHYYEKIVELQRQTNHYLEKNIHRLNEKQISEIAKLLCTLSDLLSDQKLAIIYKSSWRSLRELSGHLIGEEKRSIKE